MAVIENLDIVLGARTTKLDRGLDRSRGKVDAFEANIQKMNASARSALAPLQDMGRQLIAIVPNATAVGSALTAMFASISAGNLLSQLRSVKQETQQVAKFASDGGLGLAAYGKKTKTAAVETQAFAGALTRLPLPAIASGAAALAAGFVVVGVAVKAVSAVMAGMREQMREVDAIAKSAATANVTFNELASFRLLTEESTGKGPEVADKALQKLQLRLAEASRNGGALADQLRSVGLDAGKLIEAGPVDAMRQLAAATAGMKNPTDQLALAFRLFEEEGAAFVNAFRGGPEAIEEATRAAERLGLTLSQSQVRQIEIANDEWGRMSNIMTGVYRQMAAEGAPLITAIAREVQSVALEAKVLAKRFTAMGITLQNIARVLAAGLGYLKGWADITANLVMAYQQLKNLDFQGALGSAARAASVNGTLDALMALEQARADAINSANTPGVGAASEFEQFMQAEQAAEQSAKAQATAAAQAQTAIADRLQSLREEILLLQFGAELTDQARLSAAGATAEQLEQLRHLQAQKDSLEEMNKLRHRGQQLMEQNRSPAEQLDAELADLQRMLHAGMIDFGTFANEARRAAMEAGRGGETARPQAPPSFGALQRGSVEAFSQARKNEQNDKQASLQQQGNKLLEGVNERLEAMARNIANLQAIGNAG